MKVFLVFLGLLIVNVAFLGYQGDLGRYIHGQSVLKAVAEECAAGAALLLEEEAYGKGELIFDKAQGQAYADSHLAYVMGGFDGGEKAEYHCALFFEDDDQGYHTENPGKIPTVTAVVKVKTDDLFRLPFFSLTEFERQAKYELVY